MLLLYIYTHTNLYTQTSALTKKEKKNKSSSYIDSMFSLFRYIIDQREISTLEKKKERNKNLSVNMCCAIGLD